MNRFANIDVINAARDLMELKKLKRKIDAKEATVGEGDYYAGRKEAAWDALEKALTGGEAYTLASALDTQQGGSHYKGRSIQPVEYAYSNNLNCNCYSAVKYLTRHAEKAGALDLKKAIHFIQFELEFAYGVRSRIEYDNGRSVASPQKVAGGGGGGGGHLSTDAPPVPPRHRPVA